MRSPARIGQRLSLLVRRQLQEIRKRRFEAVTQTVLSLLGLPLAPVLVVLIRVLRPWVGVRFGKLTSVRIGHFAANTEVYLCERDAGLHGSGTRTVDIFCHTQAVCNVQLRTMWDRVLTVSPLVMFADMLSRRLPGAKDHVVPMRELTGDRDIHGLVARTPPHLSWTPEEEARGERELRRMGVPEGAPFVCFAARDKAYLDQGVIPSSDWRYHDYRNADIANYLPAVAEAARRGSVALRMGAIVERPLDCGGNPRIIDYATKYRTDFLDIYLLSRCRFFLGDTAGLFLVPFVFRRPVVLVNYICIEHVPEWGARDLFIPKKLWLRGERRFLTYREILEKGIGGYYYTEQYGRLGVEPIENTADEITAVVSEMEARLDGTWRPCDEDDELQARFWSLYGAIPVRKASPPRIGAAFLRQNRDLLQ